MRRSWRLVLINVAVGAVSAPSGQRRDCDQANGGEHVERHCSLLLCVAVVSLLAALYALASLYAILPRIGENPLFTLSAYRVPVDNSRALAKMFGKLGKGWAVECADFDKAGMAQNRGVQLYLGKLGYWFAN